MNTAACKKKKGSGTGNSGAWLVGDNGAMVNVPTLGNEIGSYDLESSYDLLDITCRGADTAFVVGEGGTLLRTFDAGESWQSIELETTESVTGVAAADQTETVYVVGHRGLALVSPDSGDTWVPFAEEIEDWSSVATSYDGSVALLTSEDGSVWRYDGALSRVLVQGVRLNSVSMSSSGRIAAAVGADGVVVRSIDGGRTWSRLATDTDAELHDVWVTNEDGFVLAVGARGVLVTIYESFLSVDTIAAGGQTLRGLHLSGDGAGLAVGDDGTALRTLDYGETWQRVDVGTTRTLRAVDDIHPVPHY